jgi:mgtE-like transporter
MTPAIGLGGNVFTTLGNRLSTSIHTGTFTRSVRPRTILGQNLIASFSLTTFMSVVLAVVTKVIAIAIGEHTIGLPDLLLISILGGVIGAIPTALLTVGLTRGAVRYEWDLDNLVAPVVSTVGDVLIIPALWVASLLVGHGAVAPSLGVAATLAACVGIVWSLRARLDELRQIVRESIPVLAIALVLDILGGLVLQKQIDSLAVLPAIFVLLPAFVSTGGALGGILCGRVSTNLHLGIVEPTSVPGTEARRDIAFLFGLTVPIFVFNAAGAALFAPLVGDGDAPGWWWTLAVALIAAALTMVTVVLIAYYTTIGAWKVEVDPDSFGVPIVSAATDFFGAVLVITTLAVLGLR